MKGKSKPDFIENCKQVGFRRSLIYGTKNAFITYPAFLDFSKFFIQEAKFQKNDYSVLIMDGHKAHTLISMLDNT